MKEYKIQVDETVEEFLEYVARSQNMSIEEVIEDAVFNQAAKISEQITEAFVVKEASL